MPETDPLVTVNKSGRISLNTPAVLKFGDDVPEAVRLGFLSDNSTVVLQAAPPEEKQAYRLRQSGRVFHLTSQHFFQRVGYRADGTQRFEVNGNPDEGVVYFSLNEPIMLRPQPEPAKPKRGRPRKNQ